MRRTIYYLSKNILETKNDKKVGAEGRFLIGSSTEVGNDVPLNNYLALHQEVMS